MTRAIIKMQIGSKQGKPNSRSLPSSRQCSSQEKTYFCLAVLCWASLPSWRPARSIQDGLHRPEISESNEMCQALLQSHMGLQTDSSSSQIVRLSLIEQRNFLLAGWYSHSVWSYGHWEVVWNKLQGMAFLNWIYLGICWWSANTIIYDFFKDLIFWFLMIACLPSEGLEGWFQLAIPSISPLLLPFPCIHVNEPPYSKISQISRLKWKGRLESGLKNKSICLCWTLQSWPDFAFLKPDIFLS